ncbi:MAG: PilN domain-containing protein [Phycisphaerales bacterium]|nr:PilN domain-containing protein [Phycisphaerales bacterium]MCI0630716.1 PilN domain-containing protein [Phycisphaerales bacterium]MCI0677320.1 PilN domain-containing protein [Phycisphaerales bacterium]
MKQHPIDLLPESIRVRSQAGLRMSRFIIASATALGLLTIAATHSSFMLIGAQDELFQAATLAEPVFATEARASELKALLQRTNEYVELYDRLALPINVSAVIATVVNCLPESAALDQFDLDAGARVVGRTPRARGLDTRDEPPRRILSGEISGFAATDQQIAELVGRLQSTPPFRDVTLDFSRTRDIHGRDAREFRLSFKIDLDVPYQVSYLDAASAAERRDAGWAGGPLRPPESGAGGNNLQDRAHVNH